MCWNLFKVSFFFTDCLNSLIISEFWASVIVYFLGRWISFKKMIQSFFKDKKKFFCFENANYRFNLIWFATISSTIEGSAKVLTSPNSSGRLAATFRKILLMILPDRVFGRPEQICNFSGTANPEIFFFTDCLNSLIICEFWDSVNFSPSTNLSMT